MKIPISEFDFTFSRSSGAGGQNVNKLNTKATLIWNMQKSRAINEAMKKRFIQNFKRFITNQGIVQITSQRFRNQSRNIIDCTEKLQNMLEKVMVPKKRRIATRPTKSSIEKRINTKKTKSDIKKTRKKIIY